MRNIRHITGYHCCSWPRSECNFCVVREVIVDEIDSRCWSTILRVVRPPMCQSLVECACCQKVVRNVQIPVSCQTMSRSVAHGQRLATLDDDGSALNSLQSAATIVFDVLFRGLRSRAVARLGIPWSLPKVRWLRGRQLWSRCRLLCMVRVLWQTWSTYLHEKDAWSFPLKKRTNKTQCRDPVVSGSGFPAVITSGPRRRQHRSGLGSAVWTTRRACWIVFRVQTWEIRHQTRPGGASCTPCVQACSVGILAHGTWLDDREIQSPPASLAVARVSITKTSSIVCGS